jgi:HD-GYP domain-containing protein (c-di-GMP phosphodiesterase class II)
VLAVADVYEAMVSHRPYRPALPESEAQEELQGGAGTKYDAAVVDCCVDVVDSGFAFTNTQT